MTPSGLAPSSRSGWTAVAALAALATVGALVAGLHFTPELRLGRGLRLQATDGIAAIAAFTAMAALVGRRSSRAGLAGLATAAAACSGFWLLLGDHSFDGPVLVDLSRDHGIHAGDVLAALPAAAAVALGWWAVRPRRRHDAG